MDDRNMEWPPDERPHYERMLAELPEHMGSLQFGAARAKGRSLSASAAIAFALDSHA